jgi:hypothetical protein
VKTLFLIIAIILYIQPMQAGYCDMETEEPSVQQVNLHDHDSDGADSKHDCCADETPEASSQCLDAVHCSSCPAGAISVFGLLKITGFPQNSQPQLSIDPSLASSHSVPLYRPPIS